MTPVTAATLGVIYPYAHDTRIDQFVDWLNAAMETFEIDTPERQAAFLAQIGHESAQLRYVRELASGAAYDTGRLAERLGNTPDDDGDGERYKGRGLIQITGTTNYRACSQALFNDSEHLIECPELLEEPKFAALSAAWFWSGHGCNELADEGNFREITRRINGGYNGYNERLALWTEAKKVLV